MSRLSRNMPAPGTMRRFVFAVAALIGLSGCAGYLAENYSSTRFDGYMTVGGKPLAVALNRNKPAFVTQVEASKAISAAFSGQAGADYPDSLHRQAATDLLARLPALGCRLQSSRRIDAITVEHDYSCRTQERLTSADVATVTEQGLLTR